MWITLASLLLAPILTGDRVRADIIGTEGEPIIETMTWRRLPTDNEVRRILPRAKPGYGYAHLECDAIRRDGRLVRCRAVADTSGYGIADDMDYQQAGLAIAPYFRADPALASRWRGREYHVSLHLFFQNGQGNNVWGSCFPFCQISFRPAPPAPAIPSSAPAPRR